MSPHLSCPTCGRAAAVRPGSTGGRNWMAVVPCRRCGAYAAYLVTAEGAERSWRVEGSVSAGVLEGEG
ncbi:MAG: hypothetical protein HY906_11330 [Deltaproteobacteria bacterium]|nr:hypothetical protein [Deltaproteobacteria bacterium]